MYDLYLRGELTLHFPEVDFYEIYTDVQFRNKNGHWEENFNAPVSQEFIFRGDVDGKIIYRLIKD